MSHVYVGWNYHDLWRKVSVGSLAQLQLSQINHRSLPGEYGSGESGRSTSCICCLLLPQLLSLSWKRVICITATIVFLHIRVWTMLCLPSFRCTNTWHSTQTRMRASKKRVWNLFKPWLKVNSASRCSSMGFFQCSVCSLQFYGGKCQQPGLLWTKKSHLLCLFRDRDIQTLKKMGMPFDTSLMQTLRKKNLCWEFQDHVLCSFFALRLSSTSNLSLRFDKTQRASAERHSIEIWILKVYVSLEY